MKNPQNKPFIIIAAFLLFGAGFITGMEYQSYKIRQAFYKAFNAPSGTPSPSPSSLETAKKESVIVTKAIGDDVVLTAGTIKINSAKESQTVSSKYSSPALAKEGTKFVIINLDVTNTTKSEFTFSPDDVFLLIDNQKREFHTYSNSIGALDNYLNVRTLSPSIKETGNILYEIPQDATGYMLVTSKNGTNEIYQILLK